MCRNIKPLFNFDPPATDAEIQAVLDGCKKLGAHAACQSFNSEYLEDFPQT